MGTPARQPRHQDLAAGGEAAPAQRPPAGEAPRELPAASPARSRAAWTELAPPLLVVAAAGAVLYRPALQCAVVSDGWHLLHIGSRPLAEAMRTRLDYHFSPVAHLLDGLLWRAFGMRDALYQVENLASLGVLGLALWALTRRLFGEPRVALLALALFLANASFFEVPLWPVVGNFQSFAALLYVAGVGAAMRSGRPPRAWVWAFAFGLLALAAFFTYEPTLSLLPVGVLAALLGAAPSPAARPRTGWRRGVPAAAAAAAVLAVAVLAKLSLAAAGDRAFFLPHDLETLRVRAIFLARAVVGVLTLRAADSLPARALGWAVRTLAGEAWLAVAATLALLLLAAAGFLVARRGGAALRFAVLWLAVHYALLVLVTTPESRHNLIAALPAAMLGSALLWSAGDALARRGWLPRRLGARGAVLVPLAALALLLPGAARDLGDAARLYGDGTAATRELRRLVEARLAAGPRLRSVVLVNLPAKVYDRGLGAYWFVNGAHFLVELASGGAVPHRQVRFVHTFEPPPGGEFANGSRPLPPRRLARRARDPATLVLAFDPGRRTIVRLDPGVPVPTAKPAAGGLR